MTEQVTGTFEVSLKPPTENSQEAQTAGLSRMSMQKQFHGPLEAQSWGEMLSVMTDVKGSAGYVALERVNGMLQGRSGSFVLQHSGIMNRGVPELDLVVVPDSATGELTGLTGEMTIRIESGKHYYEFNYALPASQ